MAGDSEWAILLMTGEGLMYLHKFARYKSEINSFILMYKLKSTETDLRVLEL
jgi:hypothetical protein